MSESTSAFPPEPPHGSPDPVQPPASEPTPHDAPPAYTPPTAPPTTPLYGEPTYAPPAVPVYGDPGYPQMPGPAFGAPVHPQDPDPSAYTALDMQPPIGLRPLRGIGTVTRWLIMVSAVLSLVTIFVQVWGMSALSSFASGLVGVATLQAYDMTSLALTGLTSLVTIAAAVCWLIWQHRAASSVSPAALRRSPGWHVGSWFIPVVAWWFPFQNVKDIVHGSNARIGNGLLGGWWALWLATSFSYAIAKSMTRGADTLPALNSAIGVSIFGDLLWILAAVFAWIVVARITEAIDPKTP